MADLSFTDGRFGIPDRTRARRSRNLGGEVATVRRAPAREPMAPDIRSADRQERVPASRVTPYVMNLDHPYAARIEGVTWATAGLWVAAHPIRDVDLPHGVETFPELPTEPLPLASVHGQRDQVRRTWVLVIGPGGRPTAMSRGGAQDDGELAGQVAATLTAAAGHGAFPERAFLAGLTAGVIDELTERIDWSDEWSLGIDEIPSRLVRLLGLRGAGDEELLGF
jgi:hypothetical protein